MGRVFAVVVVDVVVVAGAGVDDGVVEVALLPSFNKSVKEMATAGTDCVGECVFVCMFVFVFVEIELVWVFSEGNAGVR